MHDRNIAGSADEAPGFKISFVIYCFPAQTVLVKKSNHYSDFVLTFEFCP
jgi:hypothetical protein